MPCCVASLSPGSREAVSGLRVHATVFVVPKKDGKSRLCTDYRALNEFQAKPPFQMDTLQSVADCIQPNDFGMLVNLTDCYLTMGLHPSQRKYCRFRHPVTVRRMQWKTVLDPKKLLIPFPDFSSKKRPTVQ